MSHLLNALLAGYRAPLSFARACVGARSLAAHRQAPAMADAAVTIYLAQSGYA